MRTLTESLPVKPGSGTERVCVQKTSRFGELESRVPVESREFVRVLGRRAVARAAVVGSLNRIATRWAP